MRKNIMLIVTIILAVVSSVFLLIGIWTNNNTVKMIGSILLVIYSLVNFIRLLDKWDKGK